MELIELSDRLAGGARDHRQRAAITLLLTLPYLATREDVVPRWYRPVAVPVTPAGGALVVDWHQVAADVHGLHVPMSPGERSMLQIAASLVGADLVSLGDVLTHLDSHNAASLIVALYTVTSGDSVGIDSHARFAGQVDR